LTADTALWRLDEDGLRSRIKQLLGDQSEAMINLYRKDSPDATPSEIYFLIESDYRYGAKTMKIAERGPRSEKARYISTTSHGRHRCRGGS
jgi:para-nitrobenzyl esterase